MKSALLVIALAVALVSMAAFVSAFESNTINITAFVKQPIVTEGASVCDVDKEKPEKLTMRYVGGNTQIHLQDPGKVNITDNGLGTTSPVHIEANNGKDGDKARTWFLGTVILNDTFLIDAESDGATKLGSKTFVKIRSQDQLTLLQDIEFHTSCSQPLRIGDVFGGSKLESFIGNKGTEIPTP